MDKIDIFRNATIALAIIGIASLVATNFIPVQLEQSILTSGFPISLNENSDSNLNQSLVFGFHLKQGQSCNAYVSNTRDNNASQIIQVYIGFTTYSAYQEELDGGNDPHGITYSDCIRTKIRYPQAAQSVSADLTLLNEQDTYSFEFMGGVDGSYVYSIPGDYVVIVFATNSGSGEIATFDLQISVDGQGEIIRTIMTWIGWIALLAAGISLIAYIVLNRKR